MKLGAMLPTFTGDAKRVLAFARRAEVLGYDGVFAYDHFFPPGGPPDRPALEAFAILSAVGAATERVAVGTLVARAILRPAGLLAKMAASIDGLSGGRMILGMGTGDDIDRPEREAFGFPLLSGRERRAQLEETVAGVKALFRGERWPGGVHVPALTGPLLPPPLTPGGPPVWIGGRSSSMIRLAAALADGWNGWGLSLDGFIGRSRLLAETADGRPVEPTWAGIALVGADERETAELLEARRNKGLPMEIWSGNAPSFAAFLVELRDAGAAWAIVLPAGPADRLELIARAAIPLPFPPA